MNRKCLCPNCGQNNVVGYKGSYECFDCGYAWHISRWRNRKTIALLCLLIIALFIGLVLAIPQTWYLLASGRITLKAGTPPTGPTVILIPIDIGEITVEPGGEWYRHYSTTLTIEGTPADRVYVKTIILAFDIPPEKLRQNVYHLEVCYSKDNVYFQYMTFIFNGEINWEDWKQLPPENGWYFFNFTSSFPSEWLSRGQYTRGTGLRIISWYPNEDLTFNVRIYLVIEGVKG